ncbi:major facilitator superfamily domain-containing protein [Durotheca rogersii]|uniref:major facilitator superfamily domain-containing protein n=1 Tax=Durotheca rogersii TaxID=419775 RepID=UPI002220EAC8|nr:major facilitator superfamily domain-containing protein [Durotheca rogersii]KAI5861990.1 major facilitator superfamily domain-containing protein [Durotheca rogersii]
MDEKREANSDQLETVGPKRDRVLDSVSVPPNLAALSKADYDKLGRRATLKMDLIIMPIVVIMYVMNYLDRQNIASAKLANIEADLNLSPVQYQTAVSILFCSYILFQVPSNMIAGRIKWPGLYICASMTVWGGVSAVMAVVNNFAGLIVARIFLGGVEAVFFPGTLYFLSMFYNRKQFALRTAILFSGSQLGNAFGTLFALAVMNLDGVGGLAGWRWLFLVEGVITTGLALLFALILPNSNQKVIGLSKTETEWVQWNYISDMGQKDDSHETSSWAGFMMAIKDPKTWLFTGILYCTYIDGAVANFFPSVVGGLGYDRNTTYLLSAPPFILCVICMLANGFHSDRTQERFFHIVGTLSVTLVANIIAVATTNTAARYVAMMLLPASFYASAIVTLSWITGSLSQPAVKRATAIGLINSICNTPNIWCSYLYYGPPTYLTAFIVNLAATVLAIAFAVATRVYLRRQNGKLDRGEDSGPHGPTPAQVVAGFRFML